MPRIIKKDRSRLFNLNVKFKRLQKLGESLVIQIPKSWIEALNWNRETELFLELNAYHNRIIIGKNEKISSLNTPEH